MNQPIMKGAKPFHVSSLGVEGGTLVMWGVQLLPGSLVRCMAELQVSVSSRQCEVVCFQVLAWCAFSAGCLYLCPRISQMPRKNKPE